MHNDCRIPTSLALNHQDLLMNDEDKYIPTKLEDFKCKMKSLNLSRTDTIICYDNFGIFSAPRMAWTLNYFGAKNVRVLNGGLKKWVKEKREVEIGAFRRHKINEHKGTDFEYAIESPLNGITEINTIQRLAYYIVNKTASTQLVDARCPNRYDG